MKKLVATAVLLCNALINADDCPKDAPGRGDVWGHTYLQVRPVFRMAKPEVLTGFRDRALARCDGRGGALQFVPFGGQTTNAKGLARYFSPCPKTELTVDSQQNPADVLPDINPEHFGIQYCDGTNVGRFVSTIQFRPQQTYAGLGISWKQYLGWNDCCERTWWFWLNMPIVYVKNDMKLKETVNKTLTTGSPYVIGSGNVTPKNMTEAFKGTNNGFLFPTMKLKNGKIDGSQKKTQLGDIELMLGYDWANDECHHLDTYVGVVIPTSNTPKGEYVFEAIAGNGNHAGVMWGINYGLDIWNSVCNDSSLSLELAFNYRYLFSKTSTRSFDLKGRKWSRYMLVFKNLAEYQAAEPQNSNILGHVEPGINEQFTRKVSVTPRSQINFTSGLVYDSCNFRGECGYNVWARQTDKVCLKDKFQEGAVVADLNAEAVCTVPLKGFFGINRLSNIGNNDDRPNLSLGNGNEIARTDNNIIKREDLDLNSAGSPCALTHTFYGYLGYHWDDMCLPTFAGVGASYEFSAVNTAVDRWMVWGKIGFSL